MGTLLCGGRVLDPATGFDGPADVLLDGGKVAAGAHSKALRLMVLDDVASAARALRGEPR